MFSVVKKFYNYYLSPRKSFVRNLSRSLGFTPLYLPFYERAFMHRSNQETDQKYQLNNERLEFLGDAVLDSITAAFLFKKYPTQDEGFLTQMRSKLVNRKILNRIGEEMHLEILLREQGLHSVSPMMLGNALEALVGAVFLDLGYDRTQDFVSELFRKFVDVHELETINDNYKSVLLEYCQKKHTKLRYEILKQYKSKSNRDRFQIGVFIDDVQITEAEDYSKKNAEQLASQKALQILNELSNAGASED